MKIESVGSRGGGWGRKSAGWGERKEQKWCAVRESYLIAVVEPGEVCFFFFFCLLSLRCEGRIRTDSGGRICFCFVVRVLCLIDMYSSRSGTSSCSIRISRSSGRCGITVKE